MEPYKGPSILNRVVETLNSVLPGHSFTIEENKWGPTIRIERFEGADYAYLISIDNECDYQLGASLIGADEGTIFWGLSHEFWDEKSRAAAEEALLRDIRVVMQSPTRVIFLNGWLMFGCHLQYWSGGDWKNAGGYSMMKAKTVRIPSFNGPKGTWHSPAFRRPESDPSAT